MELVQSGLAVIALTELIQRLAKQDWKGAGIIVLASVVGFGAGFLGLVGLNPVTGFVAGLDAVGVHTTASAASGK